MQKELPTKERWVPLLIKLPPSLIEASDRVADDLFEGNRSQLIRTAVRQFISDRDRDLDVSGANRLEAEVA